jgi:tellurite resistance protein TerC
MLLTPPPRPNRRPHCRDERERFGPLVLRACSAPLCTPPLTAPLRALHTQIDGFELKSAIRNSGAIAGMYKESLATFGYLVAATLAFDAGVFAFKGPEAAFDFLTAYFVEDSLSVDNLFVFLLLFRYFKVPPQLVDICLNYGITGSIVLRGIFIFAGLAAVGLFSPILLGFSVFLLASSYTMLAGGEEEEEDDEPPELVTDLLAKLPITGTFEGEKFFVETPTGTQATQLTGTLVCIALCDVLFAVDSIPAVLGVTSDPFVVYTSNIAAVVGLRSLYQLLSIAVSDLVYLEKAVAIVLGFVGVKLGAEVLGVEVSSALSLGVIVATLGGGVGLSLLASDETKAEYEPSPPGVVLKFFSNLVQGDKGGKGS